jgi:hypothetical protein
VTSRFVAGTSGTQIGVTGAGGNVSSSYVTSTATGGDTRLSYNKLTFTAAGSGETIRAFTVGTGTGMAPGGSINGAHVTLEIDGTGTVSGQGCAIRATLGGTSLSPGGALSALILDTNFTGIVVLPGSAAFIRIADSGAAPGIVPLLLNIETAPAATIAPTGTSFGGTLKGLKILIGGVPYYISAYSTFS